MQDTPEHLKVSFIAMMPYKLRKFRAILDLLFTIQLANGGILPSVNETSKKTVPKGVIDQLGHSLMRIIHAFAQSDADAKIFMANWDIKDGFWRLDCAEGKEWRFDYVLPQDEGKPVKLDIPPSLQMGWIESQPYFCAASDMAQDVAEQYIETQVGSRPQHKFVQHDAQGKAFKSLPIMTNDDGKLQEMVEVYIDDFILLAVPISHEQLVHVANLIMGRIHDMFPADDEDDNNPLLLKNILKLESMRALHKDIL